MVYYSSSSYPQPTHLPHTLGITTSSTICKRRPFMSSWPSVDPVVRPFARSLSKHVKAPDILIELAALQRMSSTSQEIDAVHLQPAKDAHYPFALTRKSRTKPRSSVCVWCVAQELLSRSDCPALQVRASGHDADWERWLRDMSYAGIWDALVQNVSPLAAIRNVDPMVDLAQFCRDLAGSLLECVLRELRGTGVLHRDLMAQVRSAKYHKVPRVAAMIEEAYASSIK